MAMMICVAFGGGGAVVSVVSVLCGAGGGLTVQADVNSHQRRYRGNDAYRSPARCSGYRHRQKRQRRNTGGGRGRRDRHRNRDGPEGSGTTTTIRDSAKAVPGNASTATRPGGRVGSAVQNGIADSIKRFSDGVKGVTRLGS